MFLYYLAQFLTLNLATENKSVYFQEPWKNSENLEEISQKPVAILKKVCFFMENSLTLLNS